MIPNHKHAAEKDSISDPHDKWGRQKSEKEAGRRLGYEKGLRWRDHDNNYWWRLIYKIIPEHLRKLQVYVWVYKFTAESRIIAPNEEGAKVR